MSKIDHSANIKNLVKFAKKINKKRISQKFLSNIFRSTYDISYLYDSRFFINIFCAQKIFLRYMHTYGT